jgi:hypothetical protein
VALEGAVEAAKHSAQLVSLSEKRLNRLCAGDVDALGQEQVSFKLFQAALRDPKELDVVAPAVAAVALGDVGGD